MEFIRTLVEVDGVLCFIPHSRLLKCWGRSFEFIVVNHRNLEAIIFHEDVAEEITIPPVAAKSFNFKLGDVCTIVVK